MDRSGGVSQDGSEREQKMYRRRVWQGNNRVQIASVNWGIRGQLQLRTSKQDRERTPQNPTSRLVGSETQISEKRCTANIIHLHRWAEMFVLKGIVSLIWYILQLGKRRIRSGQRVLQRISDGIIALKEER